MSDKAESNIIKHATDEFKQLMNQNMKSLKNFLGNEKNALRFLSSVTHSIQTNPRLLECSQQSLLGAFMECASLGMYPSNHSGDCYIIPYKDYSAGMQAQFQMGYRGFKTLAYRAGMLRIGSEIVYKNDKFKQYKGTDPRIEHEPAEGDRGEATGAYAWAEISKGNTVFSVMTKNQIMDIASTSPSVKADVKYNTHKSIWDEKSKKDPEKWMWKKTCIKQMGKLLPTSDPIITDQINRAIYLDNVSERGGYIKAQGQVVEVPFDTSKEKVETGNDKKEALRNKKQLNEPNEKQKTN